MRSRSAAPTHQPHGIPTLPASNSATPWQILRRTAETGITVVAQMQALHADTGSNELANQVVAAIREQRIYPVARMRSFELLEQSHPGHFLQGRFIS